MSLPSSPWTIPDTWTWVLIGEVAGVVGGGTPRTAEASNFDDGTIPWVTPADLSGYAATHIGRGSRNITTAGLKNSGARLLPKGTVLFSSRAPIGYVAIASNPLATNQGFKSFVLPTGLDPEYVYYYLLRAKELAVGLASGTTFQEVSGRQAAKIPLSIAPSGEQERIVDALESYFTRLAAAVATLERVQRNLKRYRASVLKSAVEGRLVPTEAELARAEGCSYESASVLLERILAERRRRWEERELAKMTAKGKVPKDDTWKAKYVEPVAPDTRDLPELPEGWCWTTLDQLTELIDGGTPSTATSHTTPRRVLRSSSVRQGSVDLSDYRFLPAAAPLASDAFLNEGELLFTRLSGTLAYVGNCAVVPPLPPVRLEFPDRLFRARASVLARGDFVSFCFGATHLRRRLEDAAKSTAGHQRISLSDLRQFFIPLPPFAEQTRIADTVGEQLSVMKAVETAVTDNGNRCARLRQSILKWAFEGRLVDQDPTDEPASALLERIRSERLTSRAEPDDAFAADKKSKSPGRRKARTSNA